MNQKDNMKPNNQQPMIEDLAVDQGRADEVKGGADLATWDVVKNHPWRG